MGRPKGSKNKHIKQRKTYITRENIEVEKAKIVKEKEEIEQEKPEKRKSPEEIEQNIIALGVTKEATKESLRTMYAYGDLATNPDFLGFLNYYPIPVGLSSEQVIALYKKIAPYVRYYLPAK